MSTTTTMRKIRRRLRTATLAQAKEVIENWRRVRNKPSPEQTVFVAGAQRSGTNMIMEALDNSYNTRVYHERDSTAFDGYIMRDPSVIKDLKASARMPIFVIKALCEMDKLPDLMEQFAPAKTVWMVRHYHDMINSAMKIFKKLPRDVPNILRDPESEGWRGRGLSDETLDVLRQLYRPEMSEESLVAMFWYMRNSVFFRNNFDKNERVLPVRYEQLVTQPGDELSRVFDFIGTPYSPRISKHISAQSIGKEPAPKIDGAVQELCDQMLYSLDKSILQSRARST